ncbi:flavonol synthase/flavanone 3-hydroxylase-like [Dorcoceras hygrometricum]|uniref:Flavonol synthase/flavanone 3-hydroxylase-like n=1 Tax=Dorcoceras hygrometricum TaxID=472368 RepID=A0A2Z7AGR9_9LAMI|nr:flavonol synthase/flavanone 3-hydroxylase-like [Dorcoceras hygrometricum]
MHAIRDNSRRLQLRKGAKELNAQLNGKSSTEYVATESVIKANDSADKSQLSLKHHAQPISRWKSSVRDIRARQPSQLDGLQARQLSRPPLR